MKQKIELGKTQELIVTKETNFGVYLNTPGGDETCHILLPKSQVPEGTKLKDALEVFVYKDSEDRPIATTQKERILNILIDQRLHTFCINRYIRFL